MSDNTKNPNPRNLGDYEEGLDDDFDVPTYRRIADDGPAADVAPTGNAVPASKADIADGPAPESDAATEIIELDGTGAGPMAGSADGADETVAAAVSEPTATATSDTGAPAEETQVIPRRDIYAAAGRTAPQRIEPLAKTDEYREADADFAADADQPTQVSPAATGYDDLDGDRDRDAANTATTDPGTLGAVGGAGLGVGAAGAAVAASRDDRDDYDRDRDYDAPVVGTATADDPDDPDFREDHRDHDRDLDPRRGTLDFGLLLLRLGVGGMLLMLGLATFFQFGGAPGLGALEATFADNGYQFAGVIAVAIPTIQVIAGGLLVLGLATPLARPGDFRVPHHVRGRRRRFRLERPGRRCRAGAPAPGADRGVAGAAVHRPGPLRHRLQPRLGAPPAGELLDLLHPGHRRRDRPVVPHRRSAAVRRHDDRRHRLIRRRPDRALPA